MIILISSLVGVLLICAVVLVAYCQIKKRYMFAFSLLIMLLVVVALMVTGDIAVAYVN